VIKIGTSSLINEKYGTLNLSSLSRICEVVRELHKKGMHGAEGQQQHST
jgi:glutamate 5-kinase